MQKSIFELLSSGLAHSCVLFITVSRGITPNFTASFIEIAEALSKVRMGDDSMRWVPQQDNYSLHLVHFHWP